MTTVQTPRHSCFCHRSDWGYQAIKGQQGNAIIEFAFVLPILLLLTFGIISYSTALFDKLVITNASREAARAGVVYKTTRLSDDEIKAVATDYCAHKLLTYKISAPPPDPLITDTPILTVVPTHPASPKSGDTLTVTVTMTNYSGLYSLLINQEIKAETRMKYE